METNVSTAQPASSEPEPKPNPPAEDHPFGKPPKDLPPCEPPAPTRITDTSGVRLEVIDLRNRRDRARFIDMTAPIYAGDPNYITPLRMERMRFLDPAKNRGLKPFDIHPVLAWKGGQIVGRITAHVDNAYNAYHDARAGWFGFFESINDRKVAHALLDEACKWLRSRGAVDAIGPMNFSTNHQVGLLVENFDRPPVVEMTYNPRYYEELITSFGFGRAKDLLAWWIDVTAGLENPKIARIAKVAERVRKREGVTVRSANLKDFRNEVDRLFSLYNEAWQKNWGFVPVSRDEFDEIAATLKPIAVEDLILFVEVNGKPVAFSVTLPDVNQVMPRNGRLFPFGWLKILLGLKKIGQARLMALGTAPAHRKRGLEALLFVETALRSKAHGMIGGEISWTLEDNDLVNRAAESMGAELYRKYRLYGLTL